MVGVRVEGDGLYNPYLEKNNYPPCFREQFSLVLVTGLKQNGDVLLIYCPDFLNSF
jgi:hypothetical protein